MKIAEIEEKLVAIMVLLTETISALQAENNNLKSENETLREGIK